MDDYHHFIHRGEGHRAGRTYSVWMQPDLFDAWVVVRVHGGRRRAGVTVVTPVENRAAGERLVGRICGVRGRHGYEVVSERPNGRPSLPRSGLPGAAGSPLG